MESMKSFVTSLLKPGMVFSEPVYINDNQVFIPAKTPVKQEDIDKLHAKGISAVQTNGDPSFDGPESAEAAENQAAKPEASTKDADTKNVLLSLTEVQERKGAYRNYMQLIERMNILLLRIASGDTVTEHHSVSALSSQLFQSLRTQRDQFIDYILGGEVKGNEMAKSSVNTAILSALIGQELKLPHHKILNLVIGALLHDTGMLRIPKEITNKQGELSEAERQRINSHPLLAHGIVTRELGYHDEVGNIVLQHHERWDGKGYPFGFSGNKINLGARIVSIADAFEAMVSQKSYRNPIVGNQAIKNLLADNSRRFDPNILKVFVGIMGIYPIGSIVGLNNGVIARVSETWPYAPLRPKVQVLIDENKQAFANEQGAVIDLLKEKSLYITKAMTVKELAELNA